MSKKLGLGLVLVLLCALVGISVVYGADSGDARNYFPLKEGNKWMYDVTLPDKTKINQIIGILPNDGDTFKMGVMMNGTAIEDVHFSETDKGIFKVKRITASGTIKFEPAQLVLPSKIAVGTTWNWVSQNNKQKEKVTITSLKEKVEVPIGKFDAILVKTEGVDPSDTPYLDFAWYAKGVGVVKETFTVNNQTRVLELVKYDVK